MRSSDSGQTIKTADQQVNELALRDFRRKDKAHGEDGRPVIGSKCNRSNNFLFEMRAGAWKMQARGGMAGMGSSTCRSFNSNLFGERQI
jgi:hypothetical protein